MKDGEKEGGEVEGDEERGMEVRRRRRRREGWSGGGGGEGERDEWSGGGGGEGERDGVEWWRRRRREGWKEVSCSWLLPDVDAGADHIVCAHGLQRGQQGNIFKNTTKHLTFIKD